VLPPIRAPRRLAVTVFTVTVTHCQKKAKIGGGAIQRIQEDYPKAFDNPLHHFFNSIEVQFWATKCWGRCISWCWRMMVLVSVLVAVYIIDLVDGETRGTWELGTRHMYW